MKRSSKYNTKQSRAILAYIISLDGRHTTVSQIASYFKSKESPIGIATIYRHLDRFVENGKVRKYTLDGISGACYQYMSNENDCHQVHLKCEECGAVIYLHCDIMDSVPKHMYQEHAFQINPMKTVFYGKCSNCIDYTKSV